MQYSFSKKWTLKARELAEKLNIKYPHRISCIFSKGSKAKRTIARLHALDKALQCGMQQNAYYVIELISEKFNKLSNEEKLKTILHELLHIPKNFGGGFRHHDFVTNRRVEKIYRELSSEI
ncbi:MAG: metallopeptidase [Candidatus Diapherotrites archaeon]|nr:metallopeptidase [Candidatus Diapherotrites archaeon]